MRLAPAFAPRGPVAPHAAQPPARHIRELGRANWRSCAPSVCANCEIVKINDCTFVLLTPRGGAAAARKRPRAVGMVTARRAASLSARKRAPAVAPGRICVRANFAPQLVRAPAPGRRFLPARPRRCCGGRHVRFRAIGDACARPDAHVVILGLTDPATWQGLAVLPLISADAARRACAQVGAQPRGTPQGLPPRAVRHG